MKPCLNPNMEAPTEPNEFFIATEYHRDLLRQSEGNREKLISILHREWMLGEQQAGKLMQDVTGKSEFWTDEFEATADFLLKIKI